MDLLCCFCCCFQNKISQTKHDGFDALSVNSTVISRDESQQERPHKTPDVASNADTQGQHKHDQTSDTEDTIPLVDDDSTVKGIASDTAMHPSHGPTSDNASDMMCSDGRRNLSSGDMSHVLPHTGSPITFPDKGKETWEAQVSKLKEELDLLKKKRNEEKRMYEEDLHRKREQIKQLQEDNNELLNRLSSQAAARMTHNNPYITDLSDKNRPTKISERYSELYDNQWTDAFELLHTNHHLSEIEAIEVLRDVLSVSFHKCKEVRQLREDAVNALKQYIGEDEDSEDVAILEVMRTLKGTKRNYKKMQEEFNQHVHSELATGKNYKMIPDIRPYMDECVEICLLMNIQEPPVELRGLERLSGADFDLSAFQPYTKSGNKIEYIVWPAMYLHQNGPILRKGVAQGMRDSSYVLRTTDTEHDANKDELTTYVFGEQRAPERQSTIDQVPRDKNVDNEEKQHEENRKEPLYSADTHMGISSHRSHNKTEKSITQNGQSDGSPDREHTTQLTHTENHSTDTKLPEKVVDNPQIVNELDIIESTRL
ncbi:hypothetical protein ACJMK2_031554 [Sinanodonta woodiana]|uniref:Mitochondria-eating protein n=1 Tax=Sinanodonta woodiana TaxID=1069815 RepID=A0ABD3WZ44_SINWO